MSDSTRTAIDFGVYSITKDASLVSDQDLQPMAERLVTSLQNDGFIYLTNHGVKEELVGTLLIRSMLTHSHLGQIRVPQNHALHMT